MDDINGIKCDSLRKATMGRRVKITAACLFLFIAFLIPLPPKMLDILWICIFCLTGAAAIICLAAKNSSDLIGFVPLLLGLTVLRLITQLSTARHVIRDEPAGVLLGGAGSGLAAGGRSIAILACLLFMGISLYVVISACRKITAVSNEYLRRILPLKRMGIRTDLQLRVIDEEKADALALRIADESRFFCGMKGINLLWRAEVAVSILILLMCLLIPAAHQTLQQSSGIFSAIVPTVAALSGFSLIPLIVIVTTCAGLMKKDKLTLQKSESDVSSSRQAKKITVVALDSESIEDAELLNPDFVHRHSDEQLAEFEPQVQPAANPFPVSTDISCRNAKEYYEKLSRVIATIQSRPRVILLVSDKVHSLPVTVAVNIAIRLAQKKQKVLLVDTDAHRNAVGKVFDLDPDLMRKKIVPSSLEGLSVGCVPTEKLGSLLQKRKILDYFDTTLIYTPNVSAVRTENNGHIAKPGAFYFTDDENKNTERDIAEKLSFCGWLCLIPSVQSVLSES